MSDFTYDGMPIEAQAATELPIRQIVSTSKPYRREVEFHSALDRYMAGYRKHHDEINCAKARGNPNTRFIFFSRFANWSRAQIR